MTILRKVSSFTVAALLVGLSVSACGDKDKDAADDASGSKPATNSSTSLTAANFAEVLSDSQTKAKSAHVDMEIGAAGQTVKAQGDVAIGATPEDSAMTMTMDMGS